MAEITPDRVPDVIAELRARMGWTRADVVRHSGISRAKIWNLERGRTPTADEMHVLIDLAERHLGDVIPSTPEPESEPPPSIDIPTVEIVETSSLPESSTETSVEPVEATPTLIVADDAVDDAPVPEPPSERRFDDEVRRFSNSEIQSFKRCRRQWWLGWHRGLKPRVEPLTGVRDVGSRVHKALESYYVPMGQARVDPRDALERALVDDLTTITNFVAVGEMMPDELDKLERSASLERAMIEGYVEWLKDTGVDENLEVIAPETYVEAPLEHPSWTTQWTQETRIIGRIDVRVRRASDGARLVLDHKTVGEFTTPMQTLHMNEQMLHYILLESLQDDGRRCDGALYNMIRRVKRTATATPPFYERLEVRHNQRELDAYKTKLVGVIDDVYSVEDRLARLGDAFTPEHNQVIYPTMSADCRWKCPFFGVCPMLDDGSRAEAMIERHYEKSDPLAYYRSETIETEE